MKVYGDATADADVLESLKLALAAEQADQQTGLDEPYIHSARVEAVEQAIQTLEDAIDNNDPEVCYAPATIEHAYCETNGNVVRFTSECNGGHVTVELTHEEIRNAVGKVIILVESGLAQETYSQVPINYQVADLDEDAVDENDILRVAPIFEGKPLDELPRDIAR